MNWQAYPEYMNAGCQWMDEYPTTWVATPVKYLVTMASGVGITSESIEEIGPYPVYGGNGCRGYSNEFTHDGTRILLGRQGALCGNVHLVSGRYWASEHAIVTNPIPSASARWLAYMFESMNLGQYSQSAAQPGISADVIGNLRVPFPSRPIQEGIADFLDRETAKIDALIDKQDQLIATLREDRTATITHAVTKGLDPDAEMKDSGVTSLGQIPREWTSTRLKMLLIEPMSYGANAASDDDTPGNPRYVRITDVAADGSLKADTFRSLPVEIAAPYLLKHGDILFARSGATVGKTFMYESSWGICCFAGYLIKASVDRSKILPKYAYYLTASDSYWQHISSEQIQSTIQNVNAERYGTLPVPVPPLPDQAEIVAHLDGACARVDALINKSIDAIEVQREFRSALVTAAVTGKIDVREAV